MSQAANLTRVSDRIAHHVWLFCFYRLNGAPDFTADDLRRYVAIAVPGIAPDSPSRILRELRKQGRVDYEVVSRAQSLYRVVAVRA